MSVVSTPEDILAQLDALFPEPPDTSILGDPNIPIEEQIAHTRAISSADRRAFGVSPDSKPFENMPSEPAFSSLIQELGNCGEKAIPSLINTLTHPKRMMRFCSILALGMAVAKSFEGKELIGRPKNSLVNSALLERLQAEKSSQVRGTIMTTLGTFGEIQALETIIAVLESPLMPDRGTAQATPLEKMMYMKILFDDEQKVPRAEAARALGDMGDTRAIEPLMRLMDRDLSSETLGTFSHRYAAEALAKFGDTRAIEPIARCLKRYHELESPYQGSNQYVCPYLEKALEKLWSL